MSHLTGILNPDDLPKQPEILSVDTETLDDEQMSSTPDDDDDMTPGSDEEIDELDEETDEDEDYTEPPLASRKTTGGIADAGDDEGDLPDENATGVRPLEAEKHVASKAPVEKPRKPTAPRKRAERHDRRIDLGLLDHRAHPDCPDTLACLPDTMGRPQHTLPVILRCAILGSPRKRLTIREIYATMEAKYPYYKTAGQTWKQSVRHHLSLNRLFERQPRPVTDPGFGSYWTVNLLAPPGTKRPRKRGRANKADGSKSGSSKGEYMDGDQLNSIPQPTKFQFQPQTHPPPPPPPLPEPQVKSFNNPRAPQQYQPPPATISQPPLNLQHLTPEPPPKTSPQHSKQSHSPSKSNYSHHLNNIPYHHGSTSHHSHTFPQRSPQHLRPPPQHYHHSEREADKQRNYHQFRSVSPATPTSGHGSAYPPSSRESEVEEVVMSHHDDKAPYVTVSDDEYESEEDMSRNYDRRGTTLPTAFVPTRPSPIFSLPSFSGMDKNKDDIIEHMRQEIATLRRTSAEAVSTSIRLSEQLANANNEVARSQESVRDLEDMLQDEVKKRRDAERQREIEAERRRTAEQALGNIAGRPPNGSRMRPM